MTEPTPSPGNMIYFVLVDHFGEFGFPVGLVIYGIWSDRGEAEARARARNALMVGIRTEAWEKIDFRPDPGRVPNN